MRFRIEPLKGPLGILPLLAILGLLLLVGCESKESAGPSAPSDPQGYIDQGWSQYQSGDFDAAWESFDNAINMADAEILVAQEDSVLALTPGARDSAVAVMNEVRLLTAKAISGVGWTYIKWASTLYGPLYFTSGLNYVTALESMNYADSLEVRAVHAELLAGYACLLQLSWDWQQSNERVAGTLALDTAWQFEHDAEIDYLDLRLIRAENYYYLADFIASRDEALALNQIVGYQPGLSLEDFNLATIEGRAALFALIAALDDLI